VVTVVRALVAFVAAGLIAGCGGGGQPAPVDPQGLLDAAFSHPIPTSLTKAELDLRVNGLSSLPGPVKLTVDGPYVSGKGKRIPSVDWTVNGSFGPLGASAQVISTGADVFVEFAGSNYQVAHGAVAAENHNVRVATRAAGGTPKPLSNLGLHPRRWFDGAHYVGDETVDGVDCAHISADLDPVAVVKDGHAVANNLGLTGVTPAPQTLTPPQAASVQRDIKSASIDAWIGRDDQIVRRFNLTARFRIAPDQQDDVGGATGGAVSLDILQEDVGGQQSVTAPPGGKPISELLKQLPPIPGLNP
jgi:hypothetical protein